MKSFSLETSNSFTPQTGSFASSKTRRIKYVTCSFAMLFTIFVLYRVWMPAVTETHAPLTQNTAQEIQLGEVYTTIEPLPLEDIDGDAVSDQELGIDNTIISNEPKWQNYRVRSGDTLGRVFQNLSLSSATMYKMLRADTQRYLHHLEPGQLLDFLISSDGIIQELRARIDIKRSAVFTRHEQGYVYHVSREKGDWIERQFSGKIEHSFYESARKAGIKPKQIQDISQMFKGKVDFKRDLRTGDHFRILLKQEEVQGHMTGVSELLAIELKSRRKHVEAYFNPKDNNFYDQNGRSINPAFSRVPFHGNYRLSSGFNLQRKHPVTKQLKPHLGVDFATPIGTQIISTGDGVVAVAGTHPIAGKYLVIQHGSRYSTRYLHLNKILVKKGDKVHNGQVVALSGNTGRTAGAHIHYEFRINNRPVDPMHVKLPMTQQLSGQERDVFLAQVRDYQSQLNTTTS